MTKSVDRVAASLFSSASIRPVLQGKPATTLQDSMRQFAESIGVSSASRDDVFNRAYQRLKRHYRTEYVYKNTLAQKVFLGAHRAKNSAFLQEVPVGGSIADCMLINGESVIYEIKTELDSPFRLLKQLDDYYKIATRVYVVTHPSQTEVYRRLLGETPVGLITLNHNWGLHEEVPATPDGTRLSTKALFDVLRVHEVEKLLRDADLDVPSVPNGLRYAHWLKLAKELPVEEMRTGVGNALKLRQQNLPTLITKEKSTRPLRAMLLKTGLPSPSEGHLLRWLSQEA